VAVSLALDIGTTSVAGLTIDQTGRIVASAQAANSSGLLGLPQAPNQLLSISINVLRRLTEQMSGEFVHCLGITGQMHGFFHNNDKKPLSPPPKTHEHYIYIFQRIMNYNLCFKSVNIKFLEF
jgi:sugar (pentulose or hexulose) kinase